LPDQLFGGNSDPSARFLSQGGSAFPETGPSGAQCFFENDTVLGFGAPTVLRSSSLQSFHHVLRNVTD
jgi:hypothetical protein